MNATGSGQKKTLSRAYLEVLSRTATATSVTYKATGEKIAFQFNPNEFTVTKTAKWEAETASGDTGGMAEFKGTDATKISDLAVLLDASDQSDGDISKKVKRLLDLTVAKGKSPAVPSFVAFAWGSITYLRAYVRSVEVHYEMFNGDGTPIRATCTLTLEEITDDRGNRQNPTSGGLDVQASVGTVEGDTLSGISYRQYGDPTLWRAIAEANNIDDPLRLPGGTRLLIPPAPPVVSGRTA